MAKTLLVSIDLNDFQSPQEVGGRYSIVGSFLDKEKYSQVFTSIFNDHPTLTIEVDGVTYDDLSAIVPAEGFVAYGDVYFDDSYPFSLGLTTTQSPMGLFQYYTRTLPSPYVVNLYTEGGGDDNDCGYHLNVVLNPPEEPTGEESEIVTVTVTQNEGTLESDMTLAEIEEAIADGKTLLLKYDASGMGYDDRTYYLNLHIKEAMARFVATDPDMLQVITINQGGANLVTYPIKSPTSLQTTIEVSEWSNNTVTKEVIGVLPNDTIIVSPDPASAEVYASAGILCTDQPQTNTLVFTCDTVPSSSVTVNIVVI